MCAHDDACEYSRRFRRHVQIFGLLQRRNPKHAPGLLRAEIYILAAVQDNDNFGTIKKGTTFSRLWTPVTRRPAVLKSHTANNAGTAVHTSAARVMSGYSREPSLAQKEGTYNMGRL